MDNQFSALKNEILGRKYDLSIAFVSEQKSRELNKKYRGKDKATNVLSFALSEKGGELILSPEVIRKELKKFDKTFDELLVFLVIHGMLHLKGMQHSSTMEKLEDKYGQKYFSWNRRGLFHHQSGDRRIFKRRKKS